MLGGLLDGLVGGVMGLRGRGGAMRTDYSTETTGYKVFAAVELDFRLGEGFLEDRHGDSCSIAS